MVANRDVEHQCIQLALGFGGGASPCRTPVIQIKASHGQSTTWPPTFLPRLANEVVGAQSKSTQSTGVFVCGSS